MPSLTACFYQILNKTCLSRQHHRTNTLHHTWGHHFLASPVYAVTGHLKFFSIWKRIFSILKNTLNSDSSRQSSRHSSEMHWFVSSREWNEFGSWILEHSPKCWWNVDSRGRGSTSPFWVLWVRCITHTRSTSHETSLQTEPNQQMNAGMC